MTHLIQLEDIEWRRQGRKILSDVSFEVKHGEQWAILGLNGSGKTSLLNIIAGYHFPSSGRVEVLGTVFGQGGNIPKLREKIGFISSALDRFDKPFQRQTAQEIILTGKYNSAQLFPFHEITEEDRAWSEEILDNLRILHLKDAYFRNCSQGEQRRILIGRALMNRPPILILDEPCAGLDVRAREEVLAMMDNLANLGSSLLYVTHYIEEITPVISHVLLLKDGKVVTQGPREEVLTDDYLSQTYKLPVSVEKYEDRVYLRIERE